MAGLAALDPSREVLPGGAVSVPTTWAQRAVRAAGASIAVDGRAGPATLTALESFRAARVPQDTVRPSGEATSPTDRAPARVIIGTKTETLLSTILNTAPNSSAAQSDMSARPRTPGIVIGPNLDPTAPATVGSSGSWVPWAIGGAVLAALGLGAWWTMRGSRGAGARSFKPSRKIRVKRRR